MKPQEKQRGVQVTKIHLTGIAAASVEFLFCQLVCLSSFFEQSGNLSDVLIKVEIRNYKCMVSSSASIHR